MALPIPALAIATGTAVRPTSPPAMRTAGRRQASAQPHRRHPATARPAASHRAPRRIGAVFTLGDERRDIPR